MAPGDPHYYGMLAGFCLSVGFAIGGVIILGLLTAAHIKDWREARKTRRADET
jgi:hypothetical protein